ncbi:hypothetical protein SAZ10_00445 [Mesorhizobium sp. BAC0120]|uniref:hypothetical protein n=1 Tax=Mesorhizobium sp. BAC0120 TaxID=3090670 RepID=UPI00298C129A|nr:hypothetical protein [Mesorhizobium sp. BAC0120]MDW6020224.1 hypothetical protein [Mesorhizobium sp. BAC0120]
MERVKPWHILLVTAALVTLIVVAGCSPTARGSFCDIARPIRLSGATIDAMTDQEVAAALAHNRKGAALCSWNPAN